MSRSSRELRRARERRGRFRSRLLWGGLVAAALVVVGLLVWNSTRGLAGVPVPVLGADHIDEGTDPGTYNSDPPTSGTHYPSEADAGFYTEDEAATLAPYPAGYLVHNLEHGYIIIWYNCATMDPADCDEIKAEIQAVMDEFDGFKLIAFPWESIEQPVVLTSWGQMLEMDAFDAQLARDFIRRNRNHAPEPNAP